jgi:hypothetical protein
MFFNRKPDWRQALKTCDHAVASSALMHYLATHTPTPDLAAALEQYFATPGYPAALGVISAEPDLILLFRESRPGGIYHQLTGRAFS